MKMMNQAFKFFIKKFVIVYFDDIFIYNSTQEEYN